MLLPLFFWTINCQKVLIFDAGSSSTRVYVYQYTNASDPSTFTSYQDLTGKQAFRQVDIRLDASLNNQSVFSAIFTDLLDNYVNQFIPNSESFLGFSYFLAPM